MHFQADYVIVLVVGVIFIAFILYAMKNSRDNVKKEREENNKKGGK